MSARVLVVWCPDWPVVAALVEAGRPTAAPAAVLHAGAVEVCNGPARAESVRRGQRRRDAQARCPELVLLEANPDRDVRTFEPVLAAVEALRPGVSPMRPGLLAVQAPGRYFGGEESAAAVVAECLVDQGVWDCRVGVADDLFTAEQAARAAEVQGCRVVPPGGSGAFLRGLPVAVLEGDGPAGREAVSLLRRLGLRTLGDLADLPGEAVRQRFGRYGGDVWRRVRGEDPSLVAARTPPPELATEVPFEPPLDSVEAICFSVRTTAERFVTGLAERGLVATEVRVEAEQEGVVASSRAWLHPRHFSSRDLVDRVHWQLQSRATSGLRPGRDAGAMTAPVGLVRFVPETVEPTAAHAEGLWGGSADDQVERGVARVQALVGFDAVRRPVRQGGRSPAARQATVSWGERAVGLRPVERPWPGRVPGPPPVRVFAAPLGAEVVDEGGRAVAVTDRGVVTAEPSRFRLGATGTTTGTTAGHATLPWQPVAAWAGPWPVDESWWDGGAAPGPAARFQVVGVDGRAWLLVCGSAGWRVEAGYD
ncbi:DNA polymerase Y family protein [Nocardioides sp. AX2bis]|uniref:DNA polymerase Y family protein n=1 Tax=Nocardioides sp. AX2bis TaxID=2653157 RepID=UPI0012F1CC41|nr:DNA polymerase Y family protein [Nocardioides sp. AX2bis]VXB25176.1 DNA polymerase [Nocardioides sp. AX2bis]